MLLSFLVFVLIILIALYLANQGMLSALLALATALFSSVLAMALLEPLQGIIGGWRPDYARGVTFLLTFFLAFSATRIIADICVPRNMKLSLLINRIAGGVVGFFVGMIVVGTIVIGVELLPVNRKPLGFDRFPGAAHMQALDSDGKPLLGEVAKPANIWFAPDRFVLAIWNGTSGRSLGGDRSFASAHPNLTAEAYGYRNFVDGAHRTLVSELMEVKEASIADTQGGLRADPGKRLVLVRTEIKKGEREPKVSSENGDPAYFYISASQVRLVTSKQNSDAGHQYYPIGYMESGNHFVPLTLDNGYIVDDYVKGDHVVDDWIFQVPEDEKPTFIEVKQLARADISGILKDKPSSALAKADYPAHGYYKDLSTLTVTFDPKNRTLKSGKAYVISSVNSRKDIPNTPIADAHNHVLECDRSMKDNANGWDSTPKPGVPSLQELLAAEHAGQRLVNAKDEEAIEWYGLVPLMLLGQAQPNGATNMSVIPRYFEDSFIPMLSGARSGSLILASGAADPSTGRLDLPKIAPGQHVVLVTMEVATDGNSRAFYVWVKDIDFKAATPQSFTVTDGDNGAAFHIDLDQKMP